MGKSNTKAPSTRIRIFLKSLIFRFGLKKIASTRVVFESYKLVHMNPYISMPSSTELAHYQQTC